MATPGRRQDVSEHGAGAGTGGGPAHAGAGARTYVVVGAFLLAITVMEVWVFYVPALARVLVPILLILSTLKFVLVAMFYMHLKFDHAWFSYVFIGPLIIAIGLAIALLWLFGHIGTTGTAGLG
jgi:cytochrome c oxidase subunit 4